MMAQNNQSLSSIDSTLSNLFSQQSELDKSMSLLPQGEPRTHDGHSMSQTSSSESSFELSGFSSFMSSNDDNNSELADPFNNVFYRVFQSEKSTDIHFYARPMFNMIVSVLEKEFSTPGEDINKFLLKTHISGQKCHINVNRTDLTIVATGPGHVIWKEKNFRKMTSNMFKKFVDQTNLIVNQEEDITPSPSETSICNNSISSAASSNMSVISAMMDKIHSLQSEVTKLTTEVNKLFRQAAESVTETNNQNVNKKKDDTNSQNKDISIMNEEIQNLSGLLHVQDSKGQAASADVIMLTSTPAPGSGIPATQSQETPQMARPRPVIRPTPSVPSQPAKKILLIGDSILNGINKEGLKENIYKHGISGATIQTLLNEIEVYDLNQFSHAVIYVGGNNASNGTDIKQFESLYTQMLTHIQQKSECKIILVNSCPRGDADTNAVNSVIRRLSSKYGTELVDAYKAFHDKNYKLINKYLSDDLIHLSNSGTRRLLDMINKQLEIVQDFAYCAFERQNNRRPNKRQHKKSSVQHIRRGNLIYPGQGGSQAPCTKCGETNHETKNCKHLEQIQCHQCGYYGHKAKRCGPQ